MVGRYQVAARKVAARLIGWAIALRELDEPGGYACES